MNFLLNISPDQYGLKNLLSEAGFLNTLTFGLQMLLIGMAAVFAVLSLLWFCLYLFRLAFHDLPEKRAQKTVQPVAEPAPAPVEATDADEIVAVLAAAVAAAESEGDGMKFRVVSFRRK